MEDLCNQQLLLLHHLREQMMMHQSQSQLMILFGVGFKLDSCEKALQRLEYKKHIVDGVVQQQRHHLRQPHRQVPHKAGVPFQEKDLIFKLEKI